MNEKTTPHSPYQHLITRTLDFQLLWQDIFEKKVQGICSASTNEIVNEWNQFQDMGKQIHASLYKQRF